MPSTNPCVHCGVIGNMRSERVITGTLVVVEYYCGHCEHECDEERVHDLESDCRRPEDLISGEAKD